MKKFIKKLFVLTVIAAMVVTAMPLTGIDFGGIFAIKAEAATVDKRYYHKSSGDYAYYTVGEKEKDGYCVILKYLGNETNIVVPETIDGWIVKTIDEGAFVDDTENLDDTDDYWINSNLENITSVVLPETVTSIYGAFRDLKKLKSINIPKNTKYLYGSFSGCESLEKIELPEGFEHLGSYTFKNTAITELILPETLTTISQYAFSGMKIKELTLPESITELRTHILHCESLDTVIIKGFIKLAWSDAFTEAGMKNPTYPEKVIFLQAPSTDALIFRDVYDFTHNIEEGYWEFTKKKPLTNVQTYDNFEYILNENNEAIITRITKNYSFVTVPESVSDDEYIPVVEIGSRAFINRTEIRTVTLPATVKKIGENAFGACTLMNSINLSGIESIAAGAFSGCKSLKNITLPEIRYIEPGTFEYCEKLETIHIPESVKEICGSAFYNCVKLKTVTGCEGLEKIGGYAFAGTPIESIPFCKGLKEIGSEAFTFTNINDVTLPEGLEKIGSYAFECVYDFSKLILPETVKEIGDNAFYECNIEELYLPDGLEKLGKNAFYGTNISSLEIPSALTEIPNYAFANCNNLVVINIPSNIKRVGVRAFGSQMSLFAPASITIADGVEEICSRAFNGKNVDELTIPESVKIMDLSALRGININTLNFNAANAVFRMTMSDEVSILYNTSVNTVNFGNKVKSVGENFGASSDVETVNFSDSIEHIGESAFYNCQKLKEFNLPPNLQTIGDKAFAGCSVPTEVVFPDTVISIGAEAFDCCKGLIEITLPENVETVGKWAFYACDSATEITIPENVRSFSQYAFSLCRSVTTVNINAVSCTVVPETSEELPTSPFRYLESLKNINIGDTVKELPSYLFSSLNTIDVITLPDSVTDIGAGAFANSSITALKNCKNLESIEEYAFKNCVNLSSFAFADELMLIGMEAFSGCTGLNNIYIPDSVVNIEIGAFSDCSALEVVRMSPNVDYIPREAFYNCKELSTFTWDAESKLVGRLAFGNCVKLGNFDFVNVEKLYVNSFLGSGVAVVQLGESLNESSPTPLTTVEVQSFKDCENLETLGIGGNVSTVKSQAFADCTNLETAVISDSVTEIADDAFDGCDNLTIYCSETSYAYSYAQTQGIRVSTFVIAPIPNQTYTGFEIKPDVSVSLSGNTLEENADFGVTYANNINVGNADVTVKGKGDFRMFASRANFTIVTKNIAQAAVAPVVEQAYTGSAVTPLITITDGGNILREGTDYTVTYSNNTNEGTATAKITGIGNYSGSASAEFQIVKMSEPQSFFNRIFSLFSSLFARIKAFFVGIFMR